MLRYPIESAEPITAKDVAIRLYHTYRGGKTGTVSTAYQNDGVCICFDGCEGVYLWGVQAKGQKSRLKAELPATKFEVKDITLDAREKKMLERAIREVQVVLSGK